MEVEIFEIVHSSLLKKDAIFIGCVHIICKFFYSKIFVLSTVQHITFDVILYRVNLITTSKHIKSNGVRNSRCIYNIQAY